MRKPEFPEMRDQFIEEFGLKEKAKQGLDTLTAREVGKIGGETNRVMTQLAKEHLSKML